MDTITFKLRGMSCASCASAIEEAIKSVPGVVECQVNFAMEQTTIQYDSKQTGLKEIQQAVDDAGYSALPAQQQEMVAGEDDAEKAARSAESQDLQRKILVGGIISIVLRSE